ncbi:unnamed protein product [Auanema sp. JU1783]|nr:unnamed protein product [Auanema sp. JU1783]
MTFATSSTSASSHHHDNMMSSSLVDWQLYRQSPSTTGPYGSSLCWSKGLEFVLSDRPALDAFRDWISSNSIAEPLELYFALRAYERMAQQGHPQTVDLATSIHMKYTSLRTGCCHFISKKLRQEVGLRVKKLSSTGGVPDTSLFSCIESSVKNFLKQQHAQFVSSDEFLDVFNKVSLGVDTPPMSGRRSKRHSNVMLSSTHAANPQLTAEMLLRSRRTRLGESVVERMYSTPAHTGYIAQPYVCRATTSQNDSAVSSSFSSEAHPTSRLRSIREEHRRGNPTTFALPRIEHFSRSDGQQYDHSTEEGRRHFANILLKKLVREYQRREQNEQTERQLRDIGDRRCTAREIVSNTEPVDPDDDDDLDRYVERMREDSQKASAQRSPRCQLLSPCPHSPNRERSRSGPAGPTIPTSNVISSSNPSTALPACSSSSTGIPGISSNGFMPLMTSSDYPFASMALPPAPSSAHGHSYLSSPGMNTFNCYKTNDYSTRSAVYDSSGIESMAPSDHSKHSSHTRRILTAPSANHSRKSRLRTHGHSSSGVYPLITISYKGADGVPVVAHVPYVNGMMTLREFRKHLSVSSSQHVQFFFKSPLDDDDDDEISCAPYQLLLINDDSSILPVFRGRITAELKSSSPQ